MQDLFESQEQTQCWLISRDAKGKIRCIDIHYTKEDDSEYIIHRHSFQYKGKRTVQPEINITSGKVNRDAHAQTILRFLSLVKTYKDKGYKEIQNDPDSYTEEYLSSILPEYNTDSNGFKKHMLAKQIDKVSEKALNAVPFWYASRKIDGLRCSFYWDGKRIKSASRGGGDYDLALKHFIENKKFIKFFQNHPDYVLDGELYKHGKSLQQISGAARLEKNAYDCDWLQYYIYDIMIPNTPFIERIKLLINIAKELGIGFDPYHEFKEGDLQVQIVPHVKVAGYDNMMKLHNKYVEEGFEGVVIRDPKANYEFGSRKNCMIKIKKYRDDCFKVIGIEPGLRGAEDLVFILEAPNGSSFKAKPLGDRATKQEYWDNFDKKYKGHIGECKFFYYSDEGVPLQPAFKAFRWDIDN